MPLFSFATGLTLRRGDNVLEFRRLLGDGQVQFENPLTGQLFNWHITKVYREIQNGELHVVRGDDVVHRAKNDNDLDPKSLSFLTSLDALPEKYRKDLERRLDYIRSCKKQGITRGDRRNIGRIVATIAERRSERPPSSSSVMSWWRIFDQADMYPGAIVSGNVRRRRKKAMDDSVFELIRKVARKEYFTRDRHPMTRTHLLVNRALTTLKRAGSETAIPEHVSLSTVRRVINEVSPYYRDVARYGAAYTRNKWRYSLGGTQTTRVMERLEIDHTQLDLVVVCDRSGLPLGRPTITIVVDAHTGYVLSFFMSFWGAGLGPVLQAIKIAISPKDHYCAASSEIRNRWLGYGIGEMIVVDNGLEFHSRQFREVAWMLNTDVQYCAVRQPWLKPTVERLLGVQGLYLPAAGRVHKPIANYIPPDPKETACVTLSQLSTGLLKLFVDLLPMEPSRRTLIEPYEAFQDGFEKLPPPLLPSSLREIDLIAAVSKELTVGNEGVVFDYLRFNSPELQDIRRNHALRFKTTVKFHPEDLGHVYVQDPKSRNWLIVPSCHPEYTGRLSLPQHRAIRSHLKGQLNKRNTFEALSRAKLELIDLYSDFLRGNMGKRNIRAATKFGTLTSAQSLLSQEVQAPVMEKALVSPEELECEASEIPSFTAFQLD